MGTAAATTVVDLTIDEDEVPYESEGEHVIQHVMEDEHDTQDEIEDRHEFLLTEMM